MLHLTTSANLCNGVVSVADGLEQLSLLDRGVSCNVRWKPELEFLDGLWQDRYIRRKVIDSISFTSI